MESTLLLLLLLAEITCLTFGGWLVVQNKNVLLGAALLVLSYFLSILIQRMIRYTVKISALKKAIKKGDYHEAEDILVEAMKLAAKFRSTDPRIAELWNALGVIYLDNGEYAEAERCCRRAIALREESFGHDHYLVGECLYCLGRVQLCLGQLGEAECTLLRAQELVIRHPKLDRFYHPMVLSARSSLCTVQGKIVEAERLAVEAREILEAGPWRERSPMAAALTHLGEIYLKQGKLAEAESSFQRSMSVWRKTTTGETSYLVGPLRGMAEVHRQRKQFDQARALLKHAQALMEKNHGNEHPALAGIFHQQATICADQDDPVNAEALYQQALQIQEKVCPGHPDIAEFLRDYAALLKNLGRDTEAAELLERAQAPQVSQTRS